MKLILEAHRRAPVLHLFCNVRLVTLDFLTSHLPSWAVSTNVIKEAHKESDLANSSYLAALDEALLRYPMSSFSLICYGIVYPFFSSLNFKQCFYRFCCLLRELISIDGARDIPEIELLKLLCAGPVSYSHTSRLLMVHRIGQFMKTNTVLQNR